MVRMEGPGGVVGVKWRLAEIVGYRLDNAWLRVQHLAWKEMGSVCDPSHDEGLYMHDQLATLAPGVLCMLQLKHGTAWCIYGSVDALRPSLTGSPTLSDLAWSLSLSHGRWQSEWRTDIPTRPTASPEPWDERCMIRSHRCLDALVPAL